MYTTVLVPIGHTRERGTAPRSGGTLGNDIHSPDQIPARPVMSRLGVSSFRWAGRPPHREMGTIPVHRWESLDRAWQSHMTAGERLHNALWRPAHGGMSNKGATKQAHIALLVYL